MDWDQAADQHKVCLIRALADVNIDTMAVCCLHSPQFLDGFAKDRVATAFVPVPAGSR